MESKNTIGQSFEKAVKATDDIALGFCSGLQALGSNSVVIKVQNNRSLNGSVDIDTTTSSLYPQDARWDYTVGYDNRAYFVEVHPANTSNVKEMIHKKNGWKLAEYSCSRIKEDKSRSSLLLGAIGKSSYFKKFSPI